VGGPVIWQMIPDVHAVHYKQTTKHKIDDGLLLLHQANYVITQSNKSINQSVNQTVNI